jgi:signal transduction histidine kinase
LTDFAATGFVDLIAARIRAEHVAISARWLDRLRGLLTVEANEVFPSGHLLDHIPALIQEVAEYIRSPQTEALIANTAVMSKAQELGELRHAQHASVHQLLAEYRLLGGILMHFVQDELDRLALSPAASEVIEVLRRINDAIWILMQTTVNTFVSEYAETIGSHTSRIESFNRMVSHELRQPLATLMYAMPLLKADAIRNDTSRHEHLLGVMERNVVKLMQLMNQLEALSRLAPVQTDTASVQRTDCAMVAREIVRQLREMSDARDVEIQIGDGLPEIDIDRARLELMLTNLISNGIKYSDPEKPGRFVRVETAPCDDPAIACLAVHDNGIGIPPEHLATVFGRFVRAHASRDAELGIRGSGLGLAIAAECAEAVGGSIRVESTVGRGTTFFVCVPRELRADAQLP